MIPDTMTETAISADTHTTSALQEALNAVNTQLRSTDKRMETVSTDHRSAVHSALIAGKDVPKPPAELAALADHRAALVAARDHFATERDKAKALDDAEAQREEHARLNAIYREWERRAHLSYGLVLAAVLKYNQVVGVLPNMDLIAREIPHNNEGSERHRAGYGMPKKFTNEDLSLLAENHIEQLFT